MKTLEPLFEQNRQWADLQRKKDPEFFSRLLKQQQPKYLWIGCSDSRVPANQIVDLPPGEVFVHRNVANLVVHTDLNCLSVIQYAVQVLNVEHVVVCGHYGCAGVEAVAARRELGLVDNWLRHLRDIEEKYRTELDAIPSDARRLARLCEINIAEQVKNVCETTIVKNAWKSGRDLTVHGWVYTLEDGLLRDLKVCQDGESQKKSHLRP